MISVEEARQLVLSSCRRLAPREVPLGDALGLVLAEAVYAQEPVPPFANSAMDGYALRAADTVSGIARLRVVGAVMAGEDASRLAVGEGQAARIMTGAPLPPGADAVCMVENTRAEGEGYVVIEDVLAAGTSVRLAGEDIDTGHEVFAAGTRLGPAHLGVLASLGTASVRAYPRPRVGVASTGDELWSPAGPLPPGKIRDSNRPGLLARLAADGWEGVDLGTVGDDPDRLADVLAQGASSCDAVITSGGVSVGDRDLVRIVLEELGGQQARWLQVAVRPGKPFAFSVLPPNGAPAFGLPGNPVSALVSYELFVRPALRLMAGHTSLERPRLVVVAEVDLPRPRDGRLHLVRVTVRTSPEGELLARPSGGQGSHQLRAMAGANALAVLPDGDGIEAGQSVPILLLDAEGLVPR